MPFMVCPYFRDSTVLLLLCFNTHSHTTINIKSNWDISLPVSYCWWFLFDGDRRTAQLPLFTWYRCIHYYRIMILNHGLLICYSQKKLPCNTEIVWYVPNMLVWYVLNHDQSLFVIGPIIFISNFHAYCIIKNDARFTRIGASLVQLNAHANWIILSPCDLLVLVV